MLFIILPFTPGEAAGLALGLVMLGSKNAQAIEDMVGYAQETQHEKILRGLAVGIALVMYGRMEEADALIESLCRDKVRSYLLSPLHPTFCNIFKHFNSCLFHPILLKIDVFFSLIVCFYVSETSFLCVTALAVLELLL